MGSSATDVQKVSVLGKESIHCGFHLIPHIVETVVSTLASSTYVLVTDSHVANLYLKAFETEFQNRLDEKSGRFLSYVISPGETSKSREQKAVIEDFLFFKKCTRDTVVLALGGGVIGDLVGFVAATFMRGLRFVQIPTTLLAMVDSSVGGKTAIDTSYGKNLIGSFWQPEFIFIDAAFLETLPPREFSNGMAEVIKTAAIWDEAEFTSLESHPAEIFAAIQTPSENAAGRSESTRSVSQKLLLSVIKGSIAVKSHVVTIDPRETGLRNLLNFGHTIGHAIEAVLTPTLLHGECVSVGMLLEAEVARNLGILSQVSIGRLARCLKSYNLPILLSDPRIANVPAAKALTIERLMDIMAIDKKNAGKGKKIVLLTKIGATLEQKATVVADEVIATTMAEAAEVIPGAGPSKHPVTMTTPGSKSISNRALVLAALGSGTCRLKNLLHSDDTQVMMAALLELKGAKFAWEDAGETIVVEGGRGSLSVPANGKELYLGNAGTAARFLTTVCTLVQKTPEDEAEQTILTGNARMKQRPIGPLVTALRENGSEIQFQETDGCLPLAISPNGLKGGHIKLAASVSSQYVSSVLLCAPYAAEPITLELTGGQVISQPYIDMTIAMMKTFGITATRRVDSTGKNLDIYDIPKGSYVNPEVYNIESDASSATYPLAIAAITGTSCTIENIGTLSLQGDARFAKEVLEPMGCTVTQTESRTTVQGPPVGQLKALEIDMEIMTDAFLTASVLAAVAHGKTRIVGIANQRVKECNRIKAMIDELAKFGVQTTELGDGLEINGKPMDKLKRNIIVHCYDDHRVAMAFSVLGCVIEGTIMEEKRCVEKTWPNWWDDLKNKIGFEIKGIELPFLEQDLASASGNPTNSSATASVIIVGMRGSGKTFTANTAALALGWECVDADSYFEQKHGNVREFVTANGWPAFRVAELKSLEELLNRKPTGHILSLGGGIVETEPARELLHQYAQRRGPVVHVKRPVEEIVQYLGVDASRPSYEESIAEVSARRDPWYHECSSHEFFNHVGGSVSEEIDPEIIKGTRKEVARFFQHITGQRPNHAQNIGEGKRSYFLSLTYPDVTMAFPHMEELTIGIDAIEVRADLLRAPDDIGKPGPYIPDETFISDQVSSLRRVTRLPIIFTLRSQSQGGQFPDGAKREAARLLQLALRLAVEYIDVELSMPRNIIYTLRDRKGSSQIIASWHDFTGSMSWTGPEVRERYEFADTIGDIIEIVGTAKNVSDNLDLQKFALSKSGRKPLLAINQGSVGQMSRVFNTTFSPVTHGLLPSKSGPGQLTFGEIQTALYLLGQLPARKFYLFGTPISHSMSPVMHNTGFKALGLPHTYELCETPEVNDHVKSVIFGPDFGGASVTIPFKIDVIPLLDKLTPAAKKIGAVNTIAPLGDGKTLGDNTDWLGIRETVGWHVGEIHAALILGSGGTARAAIYALNALGARKIYLYNRTIAKAQALVEEFSDAPITVLEILGEWTDTNPAPNVIVSTVPAYNTTTEDSADPKKLFLPESLFKYRDGPSVVVDMAYKPVRTPLLNMAEKTKWSMVPGIEVLLHQGFHQFELWTSRKFPKKLVEKVVMEKYNSQ